MDMARFNLARHGRASRAFTLIELLIVVAILGILAMAVVPHVTSAAQVARENTLKDELRYLRTQITVYKAQHNNRAPGSNGDFITQMTQYTNELGDTSAVRDATHRLGPYFKKVPTNPLTATESVKISAAADLSTAIDGTSAWIYNPATLQIIANLSGNDSDGTAYSQY
jgi:prepilin-type N-terminal cleavage/methylation domain-containing protein